jgi:hypothetical protein
MPETTTAERALAVRADRESLNVAGLNVAHVKQTQTNLALTATGEAVLAGDVEATLFAATAATRFAGIVTAMIIPFAGPHFLDDRALWGERDSPVLLKVVAGLALRV